nr:JAB domain-containing protein [Pseudoduganella dura]
MVHYHALGLPEPSKADVRLTRTLVQALNFVDIRVADHIIVAETRHTRSPNTVRYKF